jgi:3-methyl-2-oxobutanoate hydroxymethyltransferase
MNKSNCNNLKRITPTEIRSQKGKEPVVCLSAYTTAMAKALDDHVDLILVGDSLGMVLYGYDNTLKVTVDMMVLHGSAVVSATKHACVVVDLPFGSYQESREIAYRNSARILAETGCSAVKLEGGREMAETVIYLVQRGVPVMGHIGLTPQHINTIGGFRVQGRTASDAERLKADAIAMSEAGAFAIVAEAMPMETGAAIAESVTAPIIGIGAGESCDGQILIAHDIFGLSGSFKPRFAKQYTDLGAQMAAAAKDFSEEVRSRRFPSPEYNYKLKKL